MIDRVANTREALILAGINEINANGVTDFSIRRVAQACNVSSAAPYKHFKDKRDFIANIIEYVNAQWAVVQDQILEKCNGDVRQQMVEVTVGYLRFLMDKPFYRQILTLKDDEFDNLYHCKQGHINSKTQEIMLNVKNTYGLSEDVWERKTLMIRSILFGAVILFDTAEFEYCEKTLNYIRYIVNREFEVL